MMASGPREASSEGTMGFGSSRCSPAVQTGLVYRNHRLLTKGDTLWISFHCKRGLLSLTMLEGLATEEGAKDGGTLV